GGLREGMSIYLQGFCDNVSDSPTVAFDRFFINLLCGESESSDIALHFNPRFDGWDKVVFNTCQDGSWGSEDKIRSMPFCKGQAFEMVIMVTSQGYQVRPTRIYIVSIIKNTVNHNKSQNKIILNLPFKMFFSLLFPVPYSNMIPGGMIPKRTIVIRGMVPYGANRCTLMLLLGLTRDIALHINPRVREGIVVRNSEIGGSWGQEDRELSLNPFMEGQYFDMSIRCGNQRFKVFVNGQHLFDFVHRLQSFTEVDMLEIQGDVQISYIHF
uniref:Galectin n=1 Tax=Lates calcarifer TaxID=8187 RepID=A0A4W6CQ72_LATCA